jgi:hypothetical protein
MSFGQLSSAVWHQSIASSRVAAHSTLKIMSTAKSLFCFGSSCTFGIISSLQLLSWLLYLFRVAARRADITFCCCIMQCGLNSRGCNTKHNSGIIYRSIRERGSLSSLILLRHMPPMWLLYFLFTIMRECIFLFSFRASESCSLTFI